MGLVSGSGTHTQNQLWSTPSKEAPTSIHHDETLDALVDPFRQPFCQRLCYYRPPRACRWGGGGSGWHRNVLTEVNGFKGLQGFKMGLGFIMGGGSENATVGWNTYLAPTYFSQAELGDNWIDAESLGSLGVGALTNSTAVENNVLDNRHIPEGLKAMICANDDDSVDEAQDQGEPTASSPFREYFSVLVELAWPRNAELRVCCSEPAGQNASVACDDPDYTFSSNTPETEGYEPLALAPHFLTEQFGARQQEALTAMLIPKINVLGKHLELDIHGILDLGAAGTKFMAGKEAGFDYYLGSSWGNAFLDCFGGDADHVLCQASREEDVAVGRDSLYYGIPMFSCSGGSSYPTRESGKACFSTDMATNERDGCPMVAAVGMCDRVCESGFCGSNDPPLQGRGTTNVISIYMKSYEGSQNEQQQQQQLVLKVVIPILVALLLGAVAAVVIVKKRRGAKAAEGAADTPKTRKADVEVADDTDSDQT